MRSANDGQGGFAPAFHGERRAFSPSLSSIGAAGYQDPGKGGFGNQCNLNADHPYGNGAPHIIAMGGNTIGSSAWPFSDEGNKKYSDVQEHR